MAEPYVNDEIWDALSRWLKEEMDYGFDKIEAIVPMLEEEARAHGLDTTWAEHFWVGYFHRAALFGVDTPQGMQALAKAAAGLVGTLVIYCKAQGTWPPKAGLPSGEIQ